MKIVALLVFLVAGASAYPSNKITNGQDADRDQFPYQLSMQWGILGIWQHICGASIISETRALTAAHCITETPDIGDFRVRAGILRLSESVASEQIIAVTSSNVHPDYNGGVNPHDVAILRLSGSFTWTASVQAIGLPLAGAVFTGQSVLSGWGSTSTGAFPIMPDTLQTVDMPLLNHAQCADALTALLGNQGPLHEEANICTGPLTGGISACSGDSGGPLTQDGQVIGIVSWGITPCGTNGAPSVYTRVANYIEFINSNM